jgi:hypothetical protein
MIWWVAKEVIAGGHTAPKCCNSDESSWDDYRSFIKDMTAGRKIRKNKPVVKFWRAALMTGMFRHPDTWRATCDAVRP